MGEGGGVEDCASTTLEKQKKNIESAFLMLV